MKLTVSGSLAAVFLPAMLCVAAAPLALAQVQPPQPPAVTAPQPPQGQPPQAQPAGNPVCIRLEAQLAAFERNSPDQARTEQIKKYETAAAQQQQQLDRLTAQSQRAGCERGGGLFSIFNPQPAACGPLNNQIQQMKGNLDRIQGDLARLQGSEPEPEREGQRRAIMAALAQNDCGPQYRQAAAQPQRGNLFESLFGPNSQVFSGTTVQGENTPAGSGYRTVCVRLCDGYYYPISYSASPSKFPDDEKACQASCPATDAQLFTHRNPGEDINQAVSQTGQLYTALPNAFKYRQSFDNACACRRTGESWSQAIKQIQDPTLQSGDVVVTEERAKQMSQPKVDAQGKPIKLEIPPRPAKPDPNAVKPPDGKDDDEPVKVTRDPNRPVRQVGPNFIAR
jgi:hypothetical protein